MQAPLTQNQIISFILNDVDDKEHKKILHAINTDEKTKGCYLIEKRKYDVERYLLNEMSIGERFEFEELLKKNPLLYEHFTISKKINRYYEAEALKGQLEQIHAELCDTAYVKPQVKTSSDNPPDKKLIPFPKKNRVSTIFNAGKWVAAASVLIFATFSYIHIVSNRGTIENRIYSANYEPFQNVTNNYFNSSPLIEAKNKYKDKQYRAALALIENLPNSIKIESEKTLYAGLTLMGLEKYSEAIEKFKSLQSNSKQTVTHSIAQWYLALCYLKTGKKPEAIKILKKIIDFKGYNYLKAEKILNTLKKGD